MTLEKALNDGRGALDAWLEVNNEAEVRDAINTLIAEAVAKEREACARVCDNADQEYDCIGVPYKLNHTCADTIRARGR